MKKLLILLGTLIVTIALLVSAAVFLFSSSPFEQINGEHVLKYSPDAKELYVFYNGKTIGTPIECDSYDTLSRCPNLAAVLFRATQGIGINAKTTYYVANGEKITTLPDDLNYLELSADGKSVTAIDVSQEVKKYYLYNISNQSKTEFKYEGIELRNAVYSEDFSSILYTSTSVENGAITLNLNLYTNGESIKLSSDMYPLAVSNDGEHIYAYVVVSPEPSIEFPSGKGLFTLYELNKNGEKVKIAEKFQKNYVYFNKDCSQVVYVADEGAFFREYGAESSVKLGKATTCAPIYPAGVCSVEDFRGLPIRLYSEESGVRAYRIEDDKSNVEKITSDFLDIHLTSDGKTLYYIKDQSIRRTDVDDPSNEETLVEAKASAIYCSRDGEDVYYVERGSIYYISEDNVGVDISDNAKNCAITDDGVLLYVEQDNTLYYSEDGKNGKKISDDVITMIIYHGTVFYFTDRTNHEAVATAFYSEDGKSFEAVDGGKKFKYVDR